MVAVAGQWGRAPLPPTPTPWSREGRSFCRETPGGGGEEGATKAGWAKREDEHEGGNGPPTRLHHLRERRGEESGGVGSDGMYSVRERVQDRGGNQAIRRHD